jgi:hypothetical protein
VLSGGKPSMTAASWASAAPQRQPAKMRRALTMLARVLLPLRYNNKQ